MKKISTLVIGILFILLLVAAYGEARQKKSGHEPHPLPNNQKAELKNVDKNTQTKSDSFTFLFYADSRGQPSSNWHQKRHAEFVKKMLENESKTDVKHLIFGGDSVWLGFLDGQWNRFFKVMDNLTNREYKIYPALGNHELVLAKFLYAVYELIKKDTKNILIIPMSEKGKARWVEHLREDPKKMDRLKFKIKTIMEDPFFNKELEGFKESLKKEDTFTDEKKAKIMIKIEKVVYPAAQVVSLSDFESFSMKEAKIHPAHLDRFLKYVERWPHLKEVVDPEKTYYSFFLPSSDAPKVKFIILDSNIKKYQQQKTWYKSQLEEGFSGPVVVVCHHPLFYPRRDWFSMEFIMPQLVLTGHHHDYERLSKKDRGDEPPVYIISGSGGAHLDKITHIDSGDVKKYAYCFNYVRVAVDSENIFIKVFGCEKEKGGLSAFKVIDEMNFPWKVKKSLESDYPRP